MRILSLMALLASLSISHAAETQHEVQASSRGLFVFDSDLNHAFSIRAGYAYGLSELLQAGTVLAFSTGSGTAAKFSAVVGPTFNFIREGQTLVNAYYLTPFLGFDYDEGFGSDFAYGGQIGKRIELATNIAWKPELGLTILASPETRPLYSFTLLHFGILF